MKKPTPHNTKTRILPKLNSVGADGQLADLQTDADYQAAISDYGALVAAADHIQIDLDLPKAKEVHPLRAAAQELEAHIHKSAVKHGLVPDLEKAGKKILRYETGVLSYTGTEGVVCNDEAID